MDEKTMAELMRTNWIWTPEWKITDDEKPQLVYFRKEFVVAEGKVPETKKVVDGVLLVRRGGLMMYTVLYQQPVW